MSSRLYIYSSRQKLTSSLINSFIEAKYELPIFFYPLFYSDADIVGNDIFANAPAGVAFFERFCDFIDTHQNKLVINQQDWLQTRKKISNELTKIAKQKWLFLEMSDVFAMSDQAFKLQAEATLAKIQLGIGYMQDALDADNPMLLDQLVEYSETGLVDFKSYFNHENYGFGWLFFDAQYAIDNPQDFDEAPTEFEKDGKFGLKNAKNEILAPAIYDTIFGFNGDSKLSVAQKNDKFVFLNYRGELEFNTEFDDLYDFFDSDNPTAIAKQGRLYGLIDRAGKWVVQPTWDDLRGLYDRGELIAAKKGDVWGVIDEAGKQIVAPSLPYNPKPNSEYDTSYYSCGPEDGEPVLYLSRQWTAFTHKNSHKIGNIYGSNDLKTVLGEGKNARYGLLNQDGDTLLETIYNEIECVYEAGAYCIKQDKKCGLYHSEKAWLLACEFDSLTSVPHMISVGEDTHSSAQWVARKGKQYGLYDSKKLAWVLPCTQGKITPFAKNVLGVVHVAPPEESGIWVHNASTGAVLAGPYESLSNCYATLSFAAVLAFTNDTVFTVGQTGLVKPLTESQADSLVMQMPNKDTHKEFYLSYAQGALIKTYFSVKLKNQYLLEDAFELENKGDYRQAIALNLQAAMQGETAGYVNAGVVLEKEPSVQNLTLARQYYQLAADANEPQGLNNLAYCYREGVGGPQDMTKAIALFKLADEKYNKMATQNLAEIYYNDGPLQDQALALKYFLSCYRFYPRPLEIGYLYDTLLNDNTNALKYYQIAGKDGSGYAHNRVGEMWQNGLLGKTDLKKALENYEKAMTSAEPNAEAGLNCAKLLIAADPAAAKVAFQFALNHADVVDGLTEFGQAQGWL